MASTPMVGFAFPANEFVDLAIAYKDRFHQPMVGKNLVWQLVEGEAKLRLETTPVDSNGNGVNSIQINLEDPNANATIRLAVWPEDEPDSKLEFECLFGAPKAAPPVSDKNILQTIYPGNDPTGQWPVSKPQDGKGTIFVKVLCCDGGGNALDEFILNTLIMDNSNNFDSVTISFSRTTSYYLNIGTFAASPNWGNSTYHINNTIFKSKDFPNSDSDFYLIKDFVPTFYASHFWPPAGSVLQPGSTYPLRACLGKGGNGALDNGADLYWRAVDDESADNIAAISPTAVTDDMGVAVGSIQCNYVEFGKSDTVKLKVFGNYEENNPKGNKYDYPTFKIGGPRFDSIAPLPDERVFDAASTKGQFIVHVQDENGSPPSGKFDMSWEASMQGEGVGKAYFDLSPTSVTVEGWSENYIFFEQVPQGTVQKVDVTLTPTEGAPYKATYKVAANKITPISPVGNDPLPVGIDITVQVSLTDPDGKPVGPRSLTVARNDQITISNLYPVTNSKGIATFNVNSSSPLTTSLSIFEPRNNVPTIVPLTFGETKKNIVTINKPVVDVRYDTQVAITANYTTDQGNPIQGSQLKLDFTLADGSPLPPNLTWMRSSATGQRGECSFWFNYSTTDGVPASPISIIATAHDDSGASDSVTLKFIGGGKENHLTLLHPANNSSQAPGTDIHVKLQLTNNHKQPMAKYPITWLFPEGVTIKTSDSVTGANGEATAVFTATAKEMLEFDVVVTAANASRHFRLNFTGNDYYDSSVFCHTNYAHNMPGGLDAVPRDESEIVVFNFIYKKNDEPQPDQWIEWNIEPMTGNLRFFDENNVNWEADHDHNVRTKTNAEGRAILKIGSSAAHLGHVIAKPVGNPSAITSPVDFAIATFSADLAEPGMKYINYEPKPIELSGQYSIDHTGFTLSIPENSTQSGFDLVVFWLANHLSDPVPSERIIITDVIEAENGVIVPFNYVTPTVGNTNTNMFCYMVVDSRTGQGYRSIPLPPAVKGTPLTNLPMPDQDRPMLAPRLYDNATIVVHGDVIDGLNVIVDYDPHYWIPKKTIHLIVYLNKHDGSFGANLTQEREITDVEINAKKMVFNFPYDQVNGYDHGTLEADYFVDKTWSAVLDNVVFNTIDPFA